MAVCDAVPTPGCKAVLDEVAKLRNAPVEGEVRMNPDGSCPPGSHLVGMGGKQGSVGPTGARCISDNPPTGTITTPPTGTITTPPTGTITTPPTGTITTPPTGTITTPPTV